MLDLTGFAMQDQQPRLVALRRGRLRDQLRRQDIIEIGGSHLARALIQCPSVTRRQVRLKASMVQKRVCQGESMNCNAPGNRRWQRTIWPVRARSIAFRMQYFQAISAQLCTVFRQPV